MLDFQRHNKGKPFIRVGHWQTSSRQWPTTVTSRHVSRTAASVYAQETETAAQLVHT